ncbi:MAG: carbohydrate ABC transporter permease [Anaerolineae bacterium]|nr:carbohydrate ABC transporter permease [Anaerolineae bacterium]
MHILELALNRRQKGSAASGTASVSVGKIAAWSFLILWIFITLFPVYWIIRMAFSTQRLLLANPTTILPAGFTLDAFKRVLGVLPIQSVIDQGGFPKVMHFGQYLLTTLLVTLLITVCSTIFNAMAAYAFARLNFPMRGKIFYLFLIAQIMPSVLGLIPNFILIQSLGWVGTIQGIVAPALLGNAFGVFFLRQFLLGINRELEEAALLDGDTLFGIFYHIIVPMSIPAITTLFVLSFISSWNELQWAYFAGGSGHVEGSTTLTVAMLAFRSQAQTGLPDFTGLMAGTLISVIPLLVVFALFGRKVVDSIQFQGYR